MESLKKQGENKNKSRTIYPKIMKILRTASLGTNFTGSYEKKGLVFLRYVSVKQLLKLTKNRLKLIYFF